MKKQLLILLFPLITGNFVMVHAQQYPTLEEVIPGGSAYRYTENIYGLQWWGDLCIRPEIESIYTIDPVSGKSADLVTLAEVNAQLEKVQAGKLSHFYNVAFPWADRKQLLLKLPRNYVVYDFEQKKIAQVIPIKEQAENLDFSNESRHIAYTIDNNLYVDDRAVTQEKRGIVCGQSVHRNEFGIHKGTFWSADGRQLAFYRMDESMVTQYPLVDITARIGEVKWVRYPMAGMTSHQVSIGIYDVETQQTIYLQTGDATDRYFTNISWAPDGKSLYLIELNRDQNHAKLCRYDTETGALTATLFEETHPKYVEPQHPITFVPWDEQLFIYQSQRDGFNHLYLYHTTGKLIRQITAGDWLVKELVGFNAKKKEIIISGTERSPLQANLFAVQFDSGKRRCLTPAEGVHGGTLSASGNYLIDNYSSPTAPRNIELVDAAKEKSHRLLTAKDPFENHRMPTIETGTIKAADGVTDLYYRLIKPADFDPSRKYPAIVYVYGGPHAQLINNSFRQGARGWDLYMANKGYILFSVDNRGSEGRGIEFENATFRRLGIEEGKDQVKGIEFLKGLPFIDPSRIGVHGWSFGGHITVALMLRYNDIYKVGVAGGPVIDWKYYEIMYGERYMDSPQSNPEGYQTTDLKRLAGNLKGRLLVIHDDQDDTCVPQHTLSFMKACVDAATYPDLFIYPTHKHNVSGRDRVHLYEKITRYFDEHL